MTTVTFFSYAPGRRLWAFNRMGSARRELGRVEGLRFWKLLGAGHGNGYSLRPDLSRYGLIGVWASPEAASAFFTDSSLAASWRANASEIWTVALRTLQTHGAWSGANPFSPLAEDNVAATPGAPVAVLTRASIRVSRLAPFWRSVPSTSERLTCAPGLLASIGTGEAPAMRPATFSLWRSMDSMLEFAYGSDEHREVIRRRRDERWYTEELFARFEPVVSRGTFDGRDPLAGLMDPLETGKHGELQWI